MRNVGAGVRKPEGTYLLGKWSRSSLSGTDHSTRSRFQATVFQHPTSQRRTPDTWNSCVSGFRPLERKHDGGSELTASAV